MSSIITEPFELKRKDGKIVTVSFYDNSDIENVKILERHYRTGDFFEKRY